VIFICYTYYPANNSNPNWQMRPPTDVTHDITLMAEKAGGKPFAFTEIGYPSSTVNNSSETSQKNCRKYVRRSSSIQKQRAVSLPLLPRVVRLSRRFLRPVRTVTSIDSAYLCGFMNTLGLKDYLTGQPKQAWAAFLNKLGGW